MKLIHKMYGDQDPKWEYITDALNAIFINHGGVAFTADHEWYIVGFLDYRPYSIIFNWDIADYTVANANVPQIERGTIRDMAHLRELVATCIKDIEKLKVDLALKFFK